MGTYLITTWQEFRRGPPEAAIYMTPSPIPLSLPAAAPLGCGNARALWVCVPHKCRAEAAWSLGGVEPCRPACLQGRQGSLPGSSPTLHVSREILISHRLG